VPIDDSRNPWSKKLNLVVIYVLINIFNIFYTIIIDVTINELFNTSFPTISKSSSSGRVVAIFVLDISASTCPLFLVRGRSQGCIHRRGSKTNKCQKLRKFMTRIYQIEKTVNTFFLPCQYFIISIKHQKVNIKSLFTDQANSFTLIAYSLFSTKDGFYFTPNFSKEAISRLRGLGGRRGLLGASF
jgi:hypothetical protein